MLIYALIIFLLSSSKGSLRSTGHYAREEVKTFEDALLEHLHSYHDIDEEEDDRRKEELLDVLNAIREEAHYRHEKRRQPRIKTYEVYDDDKKQENEYKRALYSAYKDIKSHVSSKKKKDVIQKTVKKDTIIKHSHTKKEAKTPKSHVHGHLEKKTIHTKRLVKKELQKDDDDNIIVVQEIDMISKKKVQEKDNNQVATVKVDDSIEKQQALIDKIDPKDIFLEANTNTSKNETKSPAHGRVKAPPPKVTTNKKNKDGLDRVSFIAVIGGCCVAAVAGIALAGYCWFRLRQESNELNKAHEHEEKKSAKGGTEPQSEDNKLAQSAEVFHYLHAKKQMQQMSEPLKNVEKYSAGETSDEDDDEDTVYECPGLAPPGDMKVVNPLFSDAESHYSDKQSDTLSQGETPTPPDGGSLSGDQKPPRPPE